LEKANMTANRWPGSGTLLKFAALGLTPLVLFGLWSFTDLPSRFGAVGGGQRSIAGAGGEAGDHPDEDRHLACDDHDHGPAIPGKSIELTAQARSNLQLQTRRIEAGPFTNHIEVPGIITSWPGRTHISVTSPLTGVISSINVSRGELIASGKPLFTLRLTHQDLVNTQETFLAKLGELDVEQREIERLTSVAGTGAVAGKTLINREYERDKLTASLRAARQSLLLHGLSESQIEQIETTRTLIREVVVSAPIIHEDRSLHYDVLDDDHRPGESASAKLASLQPPTDLHPEHLEAEFLVSQLDVRLGESVVAGQQIAQLSDYSQLLIEGQAYQRDANLLRTVADSKVSLQAVLNSSDASIEIIDDLRVVYIGNEIGRDSRSLPFYVELENKIERAEVRGEKRYVSWRYKPGERLTLRVPQSQISDAIVVPKGAIAEEGPERFVFVENGDLFERVPVHVVARDSLNVAIANDGQIWPGQSVAITAAHQLQMAIKNQSGAAIDPHAGHNH
jgi:multidrug efflux pump subunit AcrA (membrane-fusion protein)